MIVIVQLRNGRCVRVRPIRPEDKLLLADGHKRLSPETIQRRFLAPKPKLSQAELRYLTEVDGCDHFALVAVRCDRPDFLLAVARFVRLEDDPATAEAAIVVADPLQRQGLGKNLALMLADEARARGIQRFQATFLADNIPAQRLMEALSERLTAAAPEGATRAMVAELAA